MKTGTQLITEERERQISKEGWSPEHDDEHRGAEIAQAAKCYAHEGFLMAKYPDAPRDRFLDMPNQWPWHCDWWKPSRDPVRNLQKAGALIAAEIDRLQRIQSNKVVCNTCEDEDS